MEKVVGTLDIKQLKNVFTQSKEKEIEMWIEGNDLHFKYGFITKTMKIAPLWEDGSGGTSVCKAATRGRTRNCRLHGWVPRPQDPELFKGALIESTELRDIGDAQGFLFEK